MPTVALHARSGKNFSALRDAPSGSTSSTGTRALLCDLKALSD